MGSNEPVYTTENWVRTLGKKDTDRITLACLHG